MNPHAFHIFCDEAGNTGAALLDKNQPVFVLSSVYFSDEEASEILENVKSTQAKEIKFTTLKKNNGGRRKIIEFLSQPSLSPHRVKTSLFHKEYMVVAKLVDIIVETFASKNGVDLYERGGNIALSNLLFYATPVLCGQDRFKSFLESFVVMIRNKDEQSIQTFIYWAWQLHELCIDEQYQSLLKPFLISQQIIKKILEDVTYLFLDPAIPSFFNHCVAWGEQFDSEFDVTHDISKPLFAERALLQAFMDKTIPYSEVGYDRRKFVFPLKANKLNFADSKDYLQLQIADLIASATAYLSGCKVMGLSDEFSNALEQEVNVNRFLINVVWPSPEVTPTELGTDH